LQTKLYAMEISYNTPIEVTKDKYEILMNDFASIVAGRIDGDKYYIKVWVMKYAPYIKKVIEA
jgi:hypothetical protein